MTAKEMAKLANTLSEDDVWALRAALDHRLGCYPIASMFVRDVRNYITDVQLSIGECSDDIVREACEHVARHAELDMEDFWYDAVEYIKQTPEELAD